MNAVQLSVIVPAYNSLATIRECVECIQVQLTDMPNAEIIVVDNGKNPGIESQLPPNGVVLLNRQQSNSAAYARNEGCKHRESQIYVFIDSDVIVQDGCIRNLIAPVLSGEAHAAIGNYSTEVGPLSFAQKYKQLYIHNVYRRRPVFIQNDFWTAISAIDARVFCELGGFNTMFGGASGEDQELGIRLSRRGYTTKQVNNALGLHKHNYDVFKIIKNDLKKGLTVLENTLDNKVPLTDHGHASKRDIMAVFLACLAVLALLIAIVSTSENMAILSVTLLMIWPITKADLIKLFLQSQGLLFTLATLPLMFLLDLVRASCVILGLLKRILPSGKKRHKADSPTFKGHINLVSVMEKSEE